MMESDSANNTEQQTEQFIRLLMENERRIYAFILHLVPNISDADDLMQETATLIWRKFADFQLNTDFAAWGVQIAYNVVRNYRKKRMRSRLIFNNELIHLLYEESPELRNHTDRCAEALRHCVQKLPPAEHDMVKAHYENGVSVKHLAEQLEFSLSKTYRRLVSIHMRLLSCIRNNMLAQDSQ